MIGLDDAPPTPGYVYFAGRNGHIKIGYSTAVEARMRNLKATLLGQFEGSIADERATHRRFADFAIGGEWFLDVEEIRDYIAHLRIPASPVKVERPESVDPATLTPAEAADFLGMPEGTIRAMCRNDGAIFGVKVLAYGSGKNTRYRVPRVLLEQVAAGTLVEAQAS